MKIDFIGKFVDVDPFLRRCGVEVETTKHVFLECARALSIWECIPLVLNFDELTLEVWISGAFTTLDEEAFCLLATTLWIIWFDCNNLVF